MNTNLAVNPAMNKNPAMKKKSAVNQKTAPVTSRWHLVRIFCAFFSLVATFSAIMILSEVRTRFGWLLGLLWILGIVSGILVAPGNFCKFGLSIMGACAAFGWFILPFPFDLVTVVASVAVGFVAVIAALFCIPAIFTIYTYMTEIRYACVDWKKDITAAAAGLGAAIAAILLVLALQGITKAVEAPLMEKRFDPAAAYEIYAENHDDAPECPEDLFENPLSEEKAEDGYVRINRYAYEDKEENICCSHDLEVEFEYIDGKWRVTDHTEVRQILGFDPISGTWTGTGEFWGNFYPDNQYTLTFETLTEAGGNGTLRIYYPETIDETYAFTVRVDELRLVTDNGGADEVFADLTLIPEVPIVYGVFGGVEQMTELPFSVSLTGNVVTTTAFDYGEILLNAEG